MRNFYLKDLENETEENKNFRKVVFTSDNFQLVLMSILPGEEIGEEVHSVDQFFRIEDGEGISIINDEKKKIYDDIAIAVPKGMKHNIINTGKKPLKLYTIYTPPEHDENEIQKLKEGYKYTMKLHHAKQIVNEVLGAAAHGINAGAAYAVGGAPGAAVYGTGLVANKLMQASARRKEAKMRRQQERIQRQREQAAQNAPTYQHR